MTVDIDVESLNAHRIIREAEKRAKAYAADVARFEDWQMAHSVLRLVEALKLARERIESLEIK